MSVNKSAGRQPVTATIDGSASGVSLTTVPGGTSSLANGAETAVSSSAVQVLAANASRKWCIIQNTGSETVRIGIAGVAATTGIKLVAGAALTFELPYVVTSAIFAIRESADSIVYAVEG